MANSERVAASPQDVCPLLNGMRIPEVTLNTLHDAAFDLTKAVGAKPAVLLFYRGGW
jgi:peroxiredoxin